MLNLETILGDITRQPDLDAIVNSANGSLMPGSGVSEAIHKAAGPQLAYSCRPFAPLALGQAIATPAFRLPNRRVIHVKAPNYLRDPDPAHWLAIAITIKNVLLLAESEHVTSIGIPALSTGVYHFPLQQAAAILQGAVNEMAPSLQHLKTLRWVLVKQGTLEVFSSGRVRHGDPAVEPSFTETIDSRW